MERRLNKKIDNFIHGFKTNLCEKIQSNKLLSDNQDELLNILNYIYEYDKFELCKDDFMKRKRVKSTIPVYERCCAKRANSEQCTRRKQTDCQFCGTHIKGTPHGVITDNDVISSSTKIEVSAIDIKGIVYYLDNNNNVYDMEDIMEMKHNPRIIAKYCKHGDVYSIPEFNV